MPLKQCAGCGGKAETGAVFTAEKHNVLRFQIREKRAENFEASCGAVQRSILRFCVNLSQSMLCGDFVYQ